MVTRTIFQHVDVLYSYNARRGYEGMTQLLLWKIEEDIMLKLSFLFLLDGAMHSERSG